MTPKRVMHSKCQAPWGPQEHEKTSQVSRNSRFGGVSSGPGARGEISDTKFEAHFGGSFGDSFGGSFWVRFPGDFRGRLEACQKENTAKNPCKNTLLTARGTT